MRRKPKHEACRRSGGQGGSSRGTVWLSRDELMHMRWFEEVRCSRVKQKARGEKLKPINI
jgi:hypothetical protein